MQGNIEDQNLDVEASQVELDEAIDAEGLEVFSEVDIVKDLESGAIEVTQANGIAGLRSNTVLFGCGTNPDRLASRLRVMRAVGRVGTSVLLAKLDWRHEPGSERAIDVWWGGLENNGDMMLLFAYLLSLNAEWEDASIRVRSVVKSEDEGAEMAASLARLIPELRIRAKDRDHRSSTR